METTRLSSKGQVVLPKVVRESFQWLPGTEFEVREVPGGVLLRPLAALPETRLEEVFGCLRYQGKPTTIAEMNRGVAKMVGERHDRGRY